MTLFTLALWLSVALAGGMDLVAVAANPDLGEAERKAAFERAILEASPAEVIALAKDDHADARQRWVAIRLLGRINSPPSAEALQQLLADDMPAIRAAAAAGLGDTHRAEVVLKIAGRLEDPAVIVRGAAADALGVLGDPKAVPYLARALSDPTNSYRGSSLWVRRHYVDALSAIGTRSALDAIAAALGDTDPEVSASAIAAMEKAAGFSYAQGRSHEEQVKAWQRWWQNQK